MKVTEVCEHKHTNNDFVSFVSFGGGEFQSRMLRCFLQILFVFLGVVQMRSRDKKSSFCHCYRRSDCRAETKI